MLNWFFKDSTSTTAEDVVLETAEQPLKIESENQPRAYFQTMWIQMVTHRAIWIFNELKLADVIGNDTISIHTLCENAKCHNIRAVMSLLTVLHKAEIVVTEYKEGVMMISLHPNGAMLQNIIETTSFSDLVSAMGSTDVDMAWRNLFSVLTDETPPLMTATPTMYNILNFDFINTHAGEVEQVLRHEECDTNENKRIGVWSVDKHIDYIKSIVPNHTIINIDEDTFDTNLDILILHRVTGLYYDENFIARCKEMIKDTGFIFVIDNVQDNIHCYDQLYAYASMFGVNFPVEELVDIFTAANLQVHRMITLSPGVISLIMQKSSLV